MQYLSRSIADFISSLNIIHLGILYLCKLLIILYIINFTPQLQVDISCTFELISTAHRSKEQHAPRQGRAVETWRYLG